MYYIYYSETDVASILILFDLYCVDLVSRQGRDSPKPAEGAQWSWWSCSFMSQRHLQECTLSADRSVHGCALYGSKGW